MALGKSLGISPKNRHGAGQTPNTDYKRFTAISQKWAENVCK